MLYAFGFEVCELWDAGATWRFRGGFGFMVRLFLVFGGYLCLPVLG